MQTRSCYISVYDLEREIDKLFHQSSKASESRLVMSGTRPFELVTKGMIPLP